jgi:hypothetical protein
MVAQLVEPINLGKGRFSAGLSQIYPNFAGGDFQRDSGSLRRVSATKGFWAGLLVIHQSTRQLCKDRHGSVNVIFLSAGAVNDSLTDTAAIVVGASFWTPALKHARLQQSGYRSI